MGHLHFWVWQTSSTHAKTKTTEELEAMNAMEVGIKEGETLTEQDVTCELQVAGKTGALRIASASTKDAMQDVTIC